MPDESRQKAGGKRARTRAALVAAALDVVASKGFAGASLDEIAAHAGMTKGAIYSNFSSKAELLLEAMIAKGFTLSSPRPASATVDAELRATATELSALIRRARGEATFIAEFQLYALSDPEIRKGLAATYGESFTHMAAFFAGLKGVAPNIAPRHLAVALQSISVGFIIQSLVTPDEITDAVILETMTALARGLAGGRRATPAQKPPRPRPARH